MKKKPICKNCGKPIKFVQAFGFRKDPHWLHYQTNWTSCSLHAEPLNRREVQEYKLTLDCGHVYYNVLNPEETKMCRVCHKERKVLSAVPCSMAIYLEKKGT